MAFRFTVMIHMAMYFLNSLDIARSCKSNSPLRQHSTDQTSTRQGLRSCFLRLGTWSMLGLLTRAGFGPVFGYMFSAVLTSYVLCSFDNLYFVRFRHPIFWAVLTSIGHILQAKSYLDLGHGSRQWLWSQHCCLGYPCILNQAILMAILPLCGVGHAVAYRNGCITAEQGLPG